MGFRRRFEFGLAWRTLVLVGAVWLLAMALMTPDLRAARIVAALVALAAVASIWQLIRKTNFQVARFIESVRFEDYSQRFSDPSGAGFDVLGDAGVSPAAVPGALHAVEHAAIGILPLFTICDRWDVGGVSTPLLAETGAPTIVIYDGYPGGAGVAELGFGAADEHLSATLDVIESCRCVDGCPSCVQ